MSDDNSHNDATHLDENDVSVLEQYIKEHVDTLNAKFVKAEAEGGFATHAEIAELRERITTIEQEISKLNATPAGIASAVGEDGEPAPVLTARHVRLLDKVAAFLHDH